MCECKNYDGSDDFDAETGHCERIVTDLNRVLPEDVKVFSVVRTRKGFDARRDCNYRQYNYLVPLSSSSLFSEQDEDEVLNRMNGLLSTFCGTSNFANFTRLSKLDRAHDKTSRIISTSQGHDSVSNDLQGKRHKLVMPNGESLHKSHLLEKDFSQSNT